MSKARLKKEGIFSNLLFWLFLFLSLLDLIIPTPEDVVPVIGWLDEEEKEPVTLEDWMKSKKRS